MNKLYLYLAGGLVALFLYLQFIGLVEDNAKLEIDNSNLKEAARILAEDSQRKSKINVQRSQDLSKIEEENRTLQNDLSNLKKTPKQIQCNATPVPSGYIERVLRRSNGHKESLPR